MSDSRVPTQFACKRSLKILDDRSLLKCGVGSGPPEARLTSVLDETKDNVRKFEYDATGKYIVYVTRQDVRILDASTQASIQVIDRKGIVDAAFSPRGTYLATWERPVKAEDGSVPANLLLWETVTGKQLCAFTHKNGNQWAPQWTADEAHFLRMVTGEVHVINPTGSSNKDTISIQSKLRLEGMTEFSLSPGRSPVVAAFIAEKKGAPASVRLFALGSFTQPIAIKTFFKADKVQFMWNRLGTGILVLTQTDVDKTGKSYYGESNLYYLATAGNYDCRVALDKEGPIHDVAWHPESKEFIVVYGYMPAKSTLFDQRANKVHEFGSLPRNTVRFSPQGRILLLAGFGNLAGTVDFWDRQTLKKIATIEASNTSYCEWSPDGRYIMAATLSPRLRVDNGIRLWHYTGTLVWEESMTELYQAGWRPAPAKNWPVRASLSPAPRGITQPKTPTSPAAVGAYRPPGARGLSAPSIFRRSDDDGTSPSTTTNGKPGAPGASDQPMTKTALKNMKKREARRKQQEKEDSVSGSGSGSGKKEGGGPQTRREGSGGRRKGSSPKSSSTPTKVEVAMTTDGGKEGERKKGGGKKQPELETDVSKKLKSVKKKLRQIDDLKDRRSRGETLEATQISKMGTERSLRAEADRLEREATKALEK
ncbi:eukaryotic translation initiation factor eIF2A-domain-containing protein [Piptocephalis cylindrospora]|uniref:Eukaryotic translation initiation factor 2A n=1 Tax=Piptocephalis cylindrospora TaxID=1907219 RepID=A0A4P9Y870_9FUNG|nr:eukaryotic translation initiation factor eIF2A-domain-containing protein [Piptocephalis cylindrospora]|eukprot:RKP14982.1 eukaryotic translation initiation factor eIF2A-domain-containing protein [Piptocephalis cylindrospora]